ncbi:hypothetical protein Deipr_2163 (plasmid) [Deinococcus proteolyticus MRP]|uniref:Uncharacterized protein n=1 Tax=Deinococcus proteolyticus (strain ATCC 35074 / DSM 20540 / JCM 6276 / NBRC 101906 / NCIMB 13154 / VKM Ac-1939 / CCM 2703 / MRP) TaxID=693977 RepID=F0RPI7_DEIPM|nr:hypothetical protein Deipr_2163 [Deinococcus proteolyticus MRP]
MVWETLFQVGHECVNIRQGGLVRFHTSINRPASYFSAIQTTFPSTCQVLSVMNIIHRSQ